MIVTKSGKVVSLNGYRAQTIQGNTILFTLDEEYRPPVDIRALCSVGANAYAVGSVAYLSVGKTGNVSVTPSDNNTYSVCFASITWVQ